MLLKMKLKKINLDEYNFRESRLHDVWIQVDHIPHSMMVDIISTNLLRDIIDNIRIPIKFNPYLNENRK